MNEYKMNISKAWRSDTSKYKREESGFTAPTETNL